MLTRAETMLAPAVVAELVRTSAGNPLALLELPGTLSQTQRQGREPLEEPLHLGRGLERAFRRQLHALPEDTRRALLVAAASATEDAAATLGALSALGLESDSLAPAEEGGVVSLEGGELRFRHPLLRSAAYHAASPAERRAAHRALAEALTPAADDRRAWHLATASVGPDEAVATELERAGLN
ncbi:MAG: hypothetical protein ACRDNG_09835, partial [Gaiellaceae bacterium]